MKERKNPKRTPAGSPTRRSIPRSRDHNEQKSRANQTLKPPEPPRGTSISGLCMEAPCPGLHGHFPALPRSQFSKERNTKLTPGSRRWGPASPNWAMTGMLTCGGKTHLGTQIYSGDPESEQMGPNKRNSAKALANREEAKHVAPLSLLASQAPSDPGQVTQTSHSRTHRHWEGVLS